MYVGFKVSQMRQYVLFEPFNTMVTVAHSTITKKVTHTSKSDEGQGGIRTRKYSLSLELRYMR